jgi:hypothetical protein
MVGEAEITEEMSLQAENDGHRDLIDLLATRAGVGGRDLSALLEACDGASMEIQNDGCRHEIGVLAKRAGVGEHELNTLLEKFDGAAKLERQIASGR